MKAVSMATCELADDEGVGFWVCEKKSLSLVTCKLTDDVAVKDRVGLCVCEKSLLLAHCTLVHNGAGIRVCETPADPISDWLDILGLTDADSFEDSDTLRLGLAMSL